MRLFSCGKCDQVLFFENSTCMNCQQRVGYSVETADLVALPPEDAEGDAGIELVLPGGRQRYDEAVQRHYEQGPPQNGAESYISAYATMHPWEDWAETWAHYLHMVDTLETAKSHGLTVRVPGKGAAAHV